MNLSEFGEIKYLGDPVDDLDLLMSLPKTLQAILKESNGFILWNGGLHIRGAIHEPKWHSLRNAMHGENSINSLYPCLKETDIPFGQDCMGDQFILRDDRVIVLSAEIGELEELHLDLEQFFEKAKNDPEEFLNFNLDMELEPGKLFHAYPPYCTKSEKGVSLRAISAEEVILFHADLAKQIANVPDGAKIGFNFTE